MTDREILASAEKCFDFMKTVRRHIHKNPGVGLENSETIDYLRGVLTELGIECSFCGKCGLVATVGKGGRCILLRADTDGLPIREESGLEFASDNGNMHGCGHDLHAAMLAGCAKILYENRESLSGTVKFMFQSGEETLEGAKDMIESGVLKNPDVDAAMMLHVMTGNALTPGIIVVPDDGASAPAADYFVIEILGKGCHGSSPWEGKDPIYAAANIVPALSVINSRELKADQGAQLAICSFNGGNTLNVIPESAVLKGSLRTFDQAVRERVRARIEEISRGVCETFGVSCNVKFTAGCPGLVNNKEMCEMAEKSLSELLGNDRVISAADFSRSSKTSGSEDFAYISLEVPSVMLALSAGCTEQGHIYPLHHPKVTFDENAMINGCAAMCKNAVAYLENKK